MISWSCGSIERPVEDIPQIDFKDPDVLRILNAQDKRLTDSLLIYFQSATPNHRYLSARAFASVQDKKAIPGLIQLLSDKNPDIRRIAAFALGQIDSHQAEQALTNAFVAVDSIPEVMEANKTILEALGKVGTQKSLDLITRIKNYRAKDTLFVQGQSASLYRFGLRGMTDSLGTQRMVEIVEESDYDPLSRLYAANYLYRNRTLNLQPYTSRLIASYINERDDKVKLFLSVVLGRLNAQPALNQLLGDLNSSASSTALKCNILRSLDGYDYVKVKASVLPLLHSNDASVVATTCIYLKNNAQAYDVDYFWNLAKADTTRKITRSLLYGVANAVMPASRTISKRKINNEISKAIDSTTDPYIKINYINALSSFGWNYQLVADKLKTASHPAVKSNIVRAVAGIYRGADQNRSFNLGRRTVKRNIGKIMAEALKSKDVGMITEAASLLSDDKLDVANIFRDSLAIKAAFESLDLPKDYEAYQTLVAASKNLNFGDVQSTGGTLMNNHPIDFNQLGALSDSSTAVISTNKGNIILELFQKDAPGSVHNFIELAERGFFNGKNFHRVVPNFVIQGGCTRGDGYGIEDYTIRSEFSTRSYDDGGYVGMASSGKDTEGTQFFITHTAALHLDGKYTIFAKVKKGMDIVDDIQVGDKITNVIILF